jgi:hypothetical protein
MRTFRLFSAALARAVKSASVLLSKNEPFCYLSVWSVQLREEFVGLSLALFAFLNLNSIRSVVGRADSDAPRNAGQNR